MGAHDRKAAERYSGLQGVNTPDTRPSPPTGRPGGPEQRELFADPPRQDAPRKPWAPPRRRQPPTPPMPSSALTGAGDTLLLRKEVGRPVGCVVRRGDHFIAHAAGTGKLPGAYATQAEAKAAVFAKVKAEREARKVARRFALYHQTSRRLTNE